MENGWKLMYGLPNGFTLYLKMDINYQNVHMIKPIEPVTEQ